MLQKFYEYGNDRLPMKVLKNLHEVIDFVNPNNENLRQSMIRQRIISLKPFSGSTYIKFKDITVNFEGKEINLDSALSGRKTIIKYAK